MTTTIECITALCCQVDDQLAGLPTHPEAHLWPREVVTLGLLHALKGVGWRPCRVRVIFRHLSQAAWMVHISRSSALNRGCQDFLQPCGPNRKHTCPTCITIVLSLRTPYTARDCGHGGTRNRSTSWSLHT